MYLVLDIGGTEIKYAYMDDQGQIKSKDKFTTTSLTSLDLFLDKIKSLYSQSTDTIEGIAMAFPGVVDANLGRVEVVTAYPYLNQIDLSSLISRECDHVPVSLENDGKCAGLCEVWQGNAKGCQDAIVIVIGTGIGSAIIKEGKIHHGKHRFAGEISTMIVDYDKDEKKLITWSDLCSTKALCQKAARALQIDQINGVELFDLIHQGNKTAKDVLEQFSYDIAVQLYNLCYVYDPEVICIGGGISQQPLLMTMIQKALDQIDQQNKQLIKPNVKPCKFYNDANLLGALYYFKQHYK